MSKFNDFFRGRYGVDNLTIAMLLLSVIITRVAYIWPIGYAAAGFALYRTLSKNTGKRYKELQWFNRLAGKVRKFFAPVSALIVNGLQALIRSGRTHKTVLQQRKVYSFVKCPKCKNTLRLPKNKGKLRVTCPKCKDEFMHKT